MLAITLCVIFPCILLLHHQTAKRAFDVFSAVQYRFYSELHGRLDAIHPAPTCCQGTSCLNPRTGRTAVVTYIRDEKHFPLFEQLECTLRRTMPEMELAAMTVDGDLAECTLSKMRAMNVTLHHMNPLEFDNFYERRFAKNWLKVRAWELVDYDAVLLVDSDVAFARDLGEVFALPTAFAAILDQPGLLHKEKTVVEVFQGGVLMLRPCLGTAQHMTELLARYPELRFPYGNAEQEFISWYFRHNAWLLPLEYNTMTHPSLHGTTTLGGVAPKVLHYTSNKPFDGPIQGSPGHQFLCSDQEISSRREARSIPCRP